jgi:hypothetical protein
MQHIRITRQFHREKQTEGKLFLIDSEVIIFECFTLELPWKNNERNISCIPPGNYNAEKRISSKLGMNLHILNVENRDMILIHKGNFNTDIRGCILVGDKKIDVNGDGMLDVVDSTATIRGLLGKIFDDKISVEIV